MATQIFGRGNVFLFSTTFFNGVGQPTNPASVSIKIVVGATVVTLPMTQGGDTWTAEWDSFGAPATFVYWSILSVSPHSVDEGFFELVANVANQAAT